MIKKNTRIWLIFGVFLLLVVPVHAGNSWFEKGTDTLKSFGLTGEKVTDTASGAGLSVDEIAAGLKEALRVGSENVVRQLSATNGFNADKAIHIPLPENLSMVKTALDKVGYSSLTDDLELKLNRAAEAAAPQEDDDPLLSGLNPQQREAVLCTDHSLIIVAGPGAGALSQA